MRYFLILALFAIVFTSCGDSSNSTDKTCNPACEEWQNCNNGSCELTKGRCESSDNCTENTENPVCDLTKHECVAEETPECTTNEDCKDAEKPVCKNNICVADETPECTTNEDCKDAAKPICKNNICVPDEAPECTTNEDCKDATKPICKNNICVSEQKNDCIGLSYSDIRTSSQDENHYIDLVMDGNYYLSIEFYEDTPTGNYDLASVGVNDNYETCKQCVLIYKIADDDETVEKIFFQSEGNITITEGLAGLGESKGEVTNIKLFESTIDETTFHSTTVETPSCIEIQTGETWAWDTIPEITCNDNDTRCSEDGTKIEKCSNNEWIEETTCETYKECKTIDETATCALKDGSCEPNTKSCSEDNKIVVCGIDGVTKTPIEACTLPDVCTEDNGNFSCMSNNKTIFEIRALESNLADGEDGAVYTTSGVVTALSEHGFYIQDGVNAGIYVFLGYSETPSVTIGDEISITATARNYQGLLELVNPLLITNLSSAQNITATEIDASNITDMESQESMLVNILNPPFRVLSTDNHNNTLLQDSNNNEFVIRNSLFAYVAPVVNLKYSKLQGIITYEYGIYKLLPRMESDMEIIPDVEDCTIGGTECDENLTKTVCNETTLKCVVPVEVSDCMTSSDCENNTNGKTTCIENICTEVFIKTLAEIRTAEGNLANNQESTEYYKTTGVITAIKDKGFYIQDSTGAIYIYMSNTEFTQNTGNKVEIMGKVKNYRGLLEFVTPVIVNNGTGNLPAFTDIDALNIENAENNESMLVNFLNPPFIVTVIDTNGNATLKDANENSFKIRNSIYNFTTEINMVYSEVKGILTYEYNEFKLLPRDENDLTERVEIKDCSIGGNECSVNIIYTACNETTLKCVQPVEVNDCNENSDCENNTNGKTVCIVDTCSEPIEVEDCSNDITACSNNTNGKTVCINNTCSETVDCTINGNECDANQINIICNEITLKCEPLPSQPLNGDFENWTDDTNPENWTYNETGFSIQKETTNIHSGLAASKISRLLEAYSDNDKAQMDSSPVPVEENKSYKISAYFLDNTTDVRGRISYAWYDTDENRIGVPQYSNFTIDEANWQELIFNTENAPVNAVNMKVFIRVYKQNADVGSIYLDDITVTEK